MSMAESQLLQGQREGGEADRRTRAEITEAVYAKYGFSPDADIPPTLAEKMQKEIDEQLRAQGGGGSAATQPQQGPFEEFPQDVRDPAAPPPNSVRLARQLAARQRGFT